jgi:hypothetical protein
LLPAGPALEPATGGVAVWVLVVAAGLAVVPFILRYL